MPTKYVGDRRALAGEWVQLDRVGHRVLVYYCRTLIRELDLQTRSSILVQRCILRRRL